MYTLSFYVPEFALDEVKAAIFAVGAGRIGNYDHCCWQVLGQGQFRPLAGSNPAIGRRDEIEYVPEYRVEMVCEAQCVRAAVRAMMESHPYEQPAWQVLEMVTELPGP